MDANKSQRELVDIGIGSNKENISEWVKEIWDDYADADKSKRDGYLRKNEFKKFVTKSFK